MQKNLRMENRTKRWLLDSVIKTVGPEWDQGHLGGKGGKGGGDLASFRRAGARMKVFDDIGPEFGKEGERREGIARGFEEQGRLVSAYENFFIAALLYASAQWPYFDINDECLEWERRMISCYDKFIDYVPHPVERVDIPFKDTTLSAFLHLPAAPAEGESFPCILHIGGMDGSKENMVSLHGDSALSRGMAVLALDGPGQGETRNRGVTISSDNFAEAAETAVNWLNDRPEIDEDRIVIRGSSFGTYYGTVAAAGLKDKIKGYSGTGVCQGANHSMKFAASADLGESVDSLVYDWLRDRVDGKPVNSERIWVDSRGKINATPYWKILTMTDHWTAAWGASAQGPYPHGRETAQPDLSGHFPEPGYSARNQSFRMIVRPDIWGRQARIRLSNAHGSQPITFEDIHIGLRSMSSAIMPGTSRKMTFNGTNSVTIAEDSWQNSDPIDLDFISDPNNPLLIDKSLAVSFHIVGESGPMTYHAKASQSSYLAAKGAADVCSSEDEAAFPYATTSWFFLDALEMNMAAPTKVIVAFGDSISDGSGSTINGFDRWPDVVSRRLHAKFGNTVALVNQGIGGNQVIGPPENTPAADNLGGISALSRLERDVISLSGVSTIIWLEGINDFGFSDASAEAVIDGVRQGVARMRDAIPGVRVIGATLTTALNATTGGHGQESVDTRRRTFNKFVRTTDIYDGIIDFDAATYDDATGELRPEMVPNSCIGGPGDKLHPNRVGYQAMAAAVDIVMLVGE